LRILLIGDDKDAPARMVVHSRARRPRL
jgi:hypothetical protein